MFFLLCILFLFCSDMADVDGPISQVVIVSDPAKCPTGFTLVKRFSHLTVTH